MYTEQDISNLLKEIQSLKDEMTRMKKIQRRSRMKMLMTVLLVPLVTVPILIFAATLTVPNTYTTGQTIYASSMNQNFSAITDRINAMWDVSGTNLTYSGGNVGIGTGTPGRLLTLEHTGESAIKMSDTTSNKTYTLQNSGGYFGILDETTGLYRLRIDTSGNVGIGTASPGYGFSVANAISGNWLCMFQNNSATGNAVYIDSASASSSYYALMIKYNSGTNDLLCARTDGKVGIGTSSPGYILTVNGQPAANGYTAFTNYSDERLKKNIIPIGNILAKIMKLDPVTFNYNEKTGYDEKARSVTFSGFVAQQLKNIFPEMVGETTINGEKYFDSNLSSLPVYLVKAIQELKFEKDILKNENEVLKNKFSLLESRLAALEGRSGADRIAASRNGSLGLWAMLFE